MGAVIHSPRSSRRRRPAARKARPGWPASGDDVIDLGAARWSRAAASPRAIAGFGLPTPSSLSSRRLCFAISAISSDAKVKSSICVAGDDLCRAPIPLLPADSPVPAREKGPPGRRPLPSAAHSSTSWHRSRPRNGSNGCGSCWRRRAPIRRRVQGRAENHRRRDRASRRAAWPERGRHA